MASFMKEFEHLRIQLEEIKEATNNFGKKVIGSGGFGDVYEGEVSHSKGRSLVAIKRLDRKNGQGDPEFLKEIMLLSRYTHENLISLMGFCDEEDEKILVYEHASNGSLDRHLGDPNLTWTQRIKICLDAAKGLSYLHDPKGTYQRAIHRDIKSANILLDDKWTAKVSDFGLSKMGPANQQYSIIVTNASGTVGYCDPEYMTTYTLTKESDIYSFGVVLFEVLCGRLCFQYNNRKLKVFVPIWKRTYEENKLDDIIFRHSAMDPTSLETFSDIAFKCLQNSREKRPTMSLVVEKLENALQAQELFDLKMPREYVEILKAAGPGLKYESIDKLRLLLTNGVFLNNGKTWFAINDKGEHCVRISIADCLIPDESKNYDSPYSSKHTSRFKLGYYISKHRSRFKLGHFFSNHSSRFKLGYYSTLGEKFKTRVRTQFLSRGITYEVNLVFKCRGIIMASVCYIPLKYKLEGDTEVSMVHLVNTRQDEVLIGRLHQFTSDESTSDLEFWFQEHHYYNNLQIQGIEFQPLEYVSSQASTHWILIGPTIRPHLCVYRNDFSSYHLVGTNHS